MVFGLIIVRVTQRDSEVYHQTWNDMKWEEKNMLLSFQRVGIPTVNHAVAKSMRRQFESERRDRTTIVAMRRENLQPFGIMCPVLSSQMTEIFRL